MPRPPGFFFYTGDWLKDPSLTLCSPTTRGIWMDLLSVMHESGRTGRLQGTMQQLARLARCSASEMEAAVAELKESKSADVTLRHKIVTVINRRMVREHKERENIRLRVAKHRRNSFGNGEGNNPLPSSSSISSSNTSSLPPPRTPLGRALQMVGVEGSRKECEAISGLTPIDVLMLYREAKKKGKSAGWIVARLRNGYKPIVRIDPQPLHELIETGIISKVCDVPITGKTKYGTDKLIIDADSQVPIEIDKADLLTSKIEITGGSK